MSSVSDPGRFDCKECGRPATDVESRLCPPCSIDKILHEAVCDELEAVTTERDQLKRDLDAARADVERFRASMYALEARVLELGRERDAAIAEVERLKGFNDDAEGRYRCLNNENSRLMARAEAAEARALDEYGAWQNERDALRERNDWAFARIDHLAAALSKYGRHLTKPDGGTCSRSGDIRGSCECGYTTALDAAIARAEAADKRPPAQFWTAHGKERMRK